MQIFYCLGDFLLERIIWILKKNYLKYKIIRNWILCFFSNLNFLKKIKIKIFNLNKQLLYLLYFNIIKDKLKNEIYTSKKEIPLFILL